MTAKPAVTEFGLVFVGPPLVALKGAERPQTVCIGCNTESAPIESSEDFRMTIGMIAIWPQDALSRPRTIFMPCYRA